MTAPCCLRIAIASAITFACSAFSPPRGSLCARRLTRVVVERARNADARALEPVAR